MRTKHLLYTMALASVFAACTQDEFVTEGGNSNPLEGRKSLGKITLVEPEAASTRWVVNDWDEIVPEVGDGFSYLLVDQPRQKLDGQHDYPIDNYELVNHIHTNYIFKRNGTGWDSEANLVEGNYLLVGPAQDLQNRKPVEITLPAEQNLAFGADGKVDPLSIIKEYNRSGYPIYIGHRFLSEGSDYNNILPKRHHIFAYPEITVINNNVEGATEEPTVVKVILKSEDENMPFVINAPLSNENAARLLTNESFKAVEGDEQFPIVVGAWEGYRTEVLGVNKEDLTVEQTNEKKTLVNQDAIAANAEYIVKDAKTGEAWTTFMYNDGLGGSTYDLLAEKPTSVSKYIVINMPEGGVTLKAGESFKFNAVIPAAAYNMTKDLIIYAVLKNGDVWKKVMKANSENVTMNPGKRYPQEDYNGTVLRGDKGDYFTIGVHEGSDGVSNYIQVKDEELEGFGDADAVMTTEQLVAALADPSSTTTMNITIGGKNVVYDQRAEAALANNKAQIVNILGHIKIDGGKDGLTINPKVSFEDAAIDNGTVVFNSTTATLGTVLVDKSATLELRNAKIVETQEGPKYTAEIHNAGTLKLYNPTFANVYNYGALEVYGDMTDASITNSYAACDDNEEIISLPINLKPSVAVKAESEKVYGTYAISGELDYPIVVERLNDEVAGALTLTGDVKIVKKGEITNNGTINSLNLDKETLTVARGLNGILVNEEDGVITSKVIIEGASDLLSEIFKTASKKVPADYKAAAQATNNGEMKDVKVDGKLIMGAGSYVNGEVTASDETEGEIDNTGKGVFVGKVDEKVKVYAVFNGMDWTTDPARQAEKEKINGYQSYNVTLIRLIGEVKIGDGETGFNSIKIYGDKGIALEFAEGSSLSIGAGTLKSDLKITVSAKNIQWNGQSTGRSKFSLTGTTTKGLYIDKKTGKVAEGNVWFRRCQAISSLGSSDAVK